MTILAIYYAAAVIYWAFIAWLSFRLWQLNWTSALMFIGLLSLILFFALDNQIEAAWLIPVNPLFIWVCLLAGLIIGYFIGRRTGYSDLDVALIRKMQAEEDKFNLWEDDIVAFINSKIKDLNQANKTAAKNSAEIATGLPDKYLAHHEILTKFQSLDLEAKDFSENYQGLASHFESRYLKDIYSSKAQDEFIDSYNSLKKDFFERLSDLKLLSE